MAATLSTTSFSVKSAAGTTYAVDSSNDHVYTVKWTVRGKPNIRYARTFTEAKKIAVRLADMSNGMARR